MTIFLDFLSNTSIIQVMVIIGACISTFFIYKNESLDATEKMVAIFGEIRGVVIVNLLIRLVENYQL